LTVLASTPIADREAVTRLRAFLAAHSFAADGVRGLLKAGDDLLADRFELAVHLRRLAEHRTPLATLVEILVLSVPVRRADADEQLGADGLALMERLGLVEIGEEVNARIRLVPHDELLIASDFPAGRTQDHVAGVHRPSATLAHLTVHRPVRRALDIGTGNGIQAILLAPHAEHVVATDVNERALAFAEFNAMLNGVENIEFRAGSFLEPVQGERFDLAVANPPYVISPETEYVFRDSGLGRDRVSEQLIRALPDVLEEGAFATVMVSWIDSGEDPPRPATWLAGSGCDAFILHSRTEEALASAAAWNRDAANADAYRDRLERWADYYRREGIEAIGYGAIVLRRRQGVNWVRALQLPAEQLSAAHDHVARLFAAQDFLSETPDLLERTFRFAAGVGLEQALDPQAEAAWAIRETTLVASEGLGFRVGLDPNTARIVTAIRPDRPLRDVIAGVAADIDADPGAVGPAGAELVRRLLELGLVTPA
jgi:methylase of polypeptide subunit release factors